MYNDGVITTEFTGYYDNVEQAYVYPTAEQDLVVKFSSFYLSAADGDFTTDGAVFSSETGESEDLTIGNAPAKVFSTTMLNPDGLMDGLTWGDGEVSLGVVTSTTNYTVASGTLFYCVNGGCTVRVTATTAYKTYSGVTRSVSLSGAPGGVLLTGTTANVYTEDGKLYYCNYNAASWSSTTAPPNNFLATKYLNMGCAIVKAGGAVPTERWTVDGTTATKSEYTYVPMGTYDFSNVDAFGITFNAEAYDKMTLFDTDATDWVQNLDFTSPKTISTLISELMTEMGMTASISTNAVNTSVSWATNPITSYSVSYRQVLKWLAEVIGCNVRIGRTGDVEFITFDSASPVATITPNTIISNTRTKTRYAVPQITQAVCYNTLGAAYTSGTTTGTDYYFVANPFLDPSADLTPLTNLKTLLNGIPTYYPTAIGIACYDPRIDAGDFVSLQMPDGSSPYSVPIMRQAIKWNGTATAELTASGNQVRLIPSSLDNTDLSSVVDSNPSAVVNKIQAVGISADWITTGKLTVTDSNNQTLFDADKDNGTVQIAGFTVEDDKLAYTDASKTINIENGKIYAEDSTTQTTACVWPGFVSIKESIGGSDRTGTVDYEKLRFYTTSLVQTAEYAIGGATLVNGNDKASVNPTRILLTDNTNTATLKPDQLVFDDGAEAPILGVYKLFHDSSSTATATYTKTLPSGAYLLVHFRNGAPTTASTGLQVMVIGTSAYATVITMTGSGANIGAASGTRSHVAVTSNADGTGTVTWTVEGLSYRKLLMLRLT